jgi:hypothetical protein
LISGQFRQKTSRVASSIACRASSGVTSSTTDAHGSAEVERMFRRLFTLLPDLIATPRRSAIDGGVVFIESDCTGTLGTKPISFSVCDRFVIRDGKLFDRPSYSDPRPVLGAVLRRPSTWTRAVRSRIA